MKSIDSRRIAIALAFGAAVANAGATRTIEPHYAVVSTWTLGGEGGWDYLAFDAPSKRLFLSRATRVDVVDVTSGKLTGSIAGTAGIHGVAFAPALHRGFTSNGKANTVTVFDLDSLQFIREIPVTGRKPDAIFFDTLHDHVFTLNGASNNATVIDAGTLAVVATIALPGPPEFIAQDADGTLFVNLETDNGQISAIDTKTLAVKATWALAGCESPSGLAIDPGNHRLFSVCSNHAMAVTDSASGRQVAIVTIGAGPDACIYDATLKLVFSSNGEDGTLTVVRQIDKDHYTVAQTLPTQKTARTMALNPATHAIYLAGARIDESQAPAPGQHRRPMLPGSFTILTAAPDGTN